MASRVFCQASFFAFEKVAQNSKTSLTKRKIADVTGETTPMLQPEP
jgi:hypothetical protein